MACETRIPEGMTLPQRQSQIDEALERLERYLQAGTVRISIDASGRLSFSGWRDRDDVSDACAYRSLSVQGSAALRIALKRAETLSGNKVNERAMVAGTHSHDGGRTWERGH